MSKVNRKEILEEAINLTHGPRDSVYGDPLTNHLRIARGWEVILGTEVSPAEVALCLAWLKIARLVETPDHLDSYIDLCAYGAIAGEIAEKP